MDTTQRRLTWISALGMTEEFKPHIVSGGGSPLVRITVRQGMDDGPDVADEAPSVKSKPAKMRVAVRPEECQRAFNDARKLHPEALYEQLSEIAAEQLHMTARQLRKHVPNPFR
jgi:hypothetical protein